MKILGIGNALVDALIQLDSGQLLEQLSLPKGAMTLINLNKYNQINNILNKSSKVSLVAGGSASNTIAGLASLNITAGFIGTIANDTLGKKYEEELKKLNVISHLKISEGQSGVATTFISEDGERTFGTYLGASGNINKDSICKEDLGPYDILYIEGYLLQNKELITHAIHLAKEIGLIVALDLASYNVVEENKDFLKEIIPNNVAILFANESEAKALTGLEADEAIEILAQWVELAIVKMGNKGSWVQSHNYKIQVDALKNISCVDSTGAGDLYAAGFLYGLIHNRPYKVCAEIGTILAGEVIQHIGAKIPEEKWTQLIEEINKTAPTTDLSNPLYRP